MFAKIKKLSIRNKMLLGYLAPAAIYLGLPILVLGTTSQVFKTFQEVERVETVIGQTSNMSVGAEQMVRGMRGYLVNKNQQFLTDFKTGAELARQSATNVQPIVKNTDQKIRLERMLELVNEYYSSSCCYEVQ
jgi:CHASE3 domain sensor protein